MSTNRYLLWLRVTMPGTAKRLIFTLPRKVLPRGMANARIVNIEWDGVVHSDVEDTAEFSGYYAEVKVIDVKEWNPREPSGS
jgi:hypothetical protein